MESIRLVSVNTLRNSRKLIVVFAGMPLDSKAVTRLWPLQPTAFAFNFLHHILNHRSFVFSFSWIYIILIVFICMQMPLSHWSNRCSNLLWLLFVVLGAFQDKEYPEGRSCFSWKLHLTLCANMWAMLRNGAGSWSDLTRMSGCGHELLHNRNDYQRRWQLRAERWASNLCFKLYSSLPS
jgi:hypothetical protein